MAINRQNVEFRLFQPHKYEELNYIVYISTATYWHNGQLLVAQSTSSVDASTFQNQQCIRQLVEDELIMSLTLRIAGTYLG